MVRSRFVAIAACLAATLAFAQSQELRFDVVAITPLGPKGGPAPAVGEAYHPGGIFRDPGTNLRTLIAMAYDIQDLGLKIVGLPSWAETAGYAVNAKAGPDYPSAISPKQNEENVKAMIRAMLADRFQLRMHREERETKVLILQVKGDRAKLRAVPAPVPPEEEGRLGIALGDRGGRMTGKKVTIAHLADILSLFLKQRVVDRTGLTGFYDFEERWEAPSRPGEPLPASSLGPDGRALLVSMLDQDLGLVLKSETMPADFWVVDRVEQPGEN